MSTRDLLQSFAAWCKSGTPLALATVIETAGSTYTKAGHRILIAASGDYQGLVSGGCLEHDLALHARQVIESGMARVVGYDLRKEGDELFGLGVGCDGAIRILLQRLGPEHGYAPFTDIAAVLEGDSPGLCAVVTAGAFTGASLIVSARHSRNHGLDGAAARALEQQGRSLAGLPRLVTVPLAGEATAVLYAPLTPIPRLLLLGAGPDAVPVVALGALLGWRVTVVDHRPAHLERPGLEGATERWCTPAGQLPERMSLPSFAAAVVMNHHLATDRSWLATLAGSDIPYIGLLGPRGRRERLLRKLGAKAAHLATRLHGPAGLSIGADSPESIALSIWTQIHATRNPVAVGAASAATRSLAVAPDAGRVAAEAAPTAGDRSRGAP